MSDNAVGCASPACLNALPRHHLTAYCPCPPNKREMDPLASGGRGEIQLDQLFDAARQAQQSAYAPYSGFTVGAAVMDESGKLHAGCNVENAAYPIGTCAEAGAIAAMILSGGRRIRAILVVGDGTELVSPCGACRQRIREFGDGETLIHIAGPDGIRKTLTLEELLPFAFGPDNLK